MGRRAAKNSLVNASASAPAARTKGGRGRRQGPGGARHQGHLRGFGGHPPILLPGPNLGIHKSLYVAQDSPTTGRFPGRRSTHAGPKESADGKPFNGPRLGAGPAGRAACSFCIRTRWRYGSRPRSTFIDERNGRRAPPTGGRLPELSSRSVQKLDARRHEEREKANRAVIHQFGISESSVPTLRARVCANFVARTDAAGCRLTCRRISAGTLPVTSTRTSPGRMNLL